MTRISIVIVTWNSQDVVGQCVDSLFRHVPAADFELFVVDNDSRDKAYLETWHDRPNVKVIRNGGNLGYAKAVNIGLRDAIGEYRLILNPDTVFVSNPFPRLIAELEKDPGIGTIGPLLYGEDGKPQIEHFYPKFPTVLQFVLLRSLLGKLAPFRKLALRFCHARISPTGMTSVDQIPGAFLLFRKNLFAGAPPLNEAYFIWMEDVDFCLRVKRQGQKVVVVSDEKIVHLGGTSFKMVGVPRKKLMFTESFLTFLRLYHGLGSHIAHAILMSLNALIIAVIMTAVHAPRLSWAGIKERVVLEAKVIRMIAMSVIFRFSDG